MWLPREMMEVAHTKPEYSDKIIETRVRQEINVKSADEIVLLRGEYSVIMVRFRNLRVPAVIEISVHGSLVRLEEISVLVSSPAPLTP